MNSDQIVTAGRLAWLRLRKRERVTWPSWVAVGKALLIGRATAMRLANANKPVGTKYNRAMANWLRKHDLAEITAQERYRAILCIENLTAIEEWRAGLTDAQRRQLNHPGAVWHKWRASVKASAPTPVREPVRTSNGSAHHGAAIRWPQDYLRRAANAVREARSNDTIVIARVAL
jgi:hypothetical protein